MPVQVGTVGYKMVDQRRNDVVTDESCAAAIATSGSNVKPFRTDRSFILRGLCWPAAGCRGERSCYGSVARPCSTVTVVVE